MCNMTSSCIKPKVHDVSQRRPDDNRATALGNMYKNLVKIGHVVPEIRSQTDRQTDKQTNRKTRSLQYSATRTHNNEPHKRTACVAGEKHLVPARTISIDHDFLATLTRLLCDIRPYVYTECCPTVTKMPLQCDTPPVYLGSLRNQTVFSVI